VKYIRRASPSAVELELELIPLDLCAEFFRCLFPSPCMTIPPLFGICPCRLFDADLPCRYLSMADISWNFRKGKPGYNPQGGGGRCDRQVRAISPAFGMHRITLDMIPPDVMILQLVWFRKQKCMRSLQAIAGWYKYLVRASDINQNLQVVLT